MRDCDTMTDELVYPPIGNWGRRAACRGMDPNDFFDDPTAEAKSACVTCSVRVECLEFALTTGVRGYWAGTTERERRRLKRAAAAAPNAKPVWPTYEVTPRCPYCQNARVMVLGDTCECGGCGATWPRTS